MAISEKDHKLQAEKEKEQLAQSLEKEQAAGQDQKPEPGQQESEQEQNSSPVSSPLSSPIHSPPQKKRQLKKRLSRLKKPLPNPAPSVPGLSISLDSVEKSDDVLLRKRTAEQSKVDFEKLNIRIWEINSTSIQVGFKGSRDDFTLWLEDHEKLRNACVIYGTPNPAIAVLKLNKDSLAAKVNILEILKHYQLAYIPCRKNQEGSKPETQAPQASVTAKTQENNPEFSSNDKIAQPVLFRRKSEKGKPQSKLHRSKKASRNFRSLTSPSRLGGKK